MKPKQKPEQEPAFVMETDDRFYAIVASNPVRYQVEPDTETVLVFFVIRRASGLIDIFNVMKTFKGSQCISRNIQSKLGIPVTKIATELGAIKTHFAEGIRQATHFVINWSHLDLSKVHDKNEQIKRIQQWNRVNVYTMPEIGLN